MTPLESSKEFTVTGMQDSLRGNLPRFPHFKMRKIYSLYRIVKLKKLIYVKHSDLCVIPSKYSKSVTYCYY